MQTEECIHFFTSHPAVLDLCCKHFDDYNMCLCFRYFVSCITGTYRRCALRARNRVESV